MKHGNDSGGPLPLLIAWEVTRSCNLNCQHCRAAAKNIKYDNELKADECKKLLDNIASFSQPIIILTGGEPMLREDIYEIARHGSDLGLRMVMAPCGMLIDDGSIKKIKEAGIQAISISIDGATAESHNAFRRVPGAFEGAMAAMEAAKRNDLPFQINTTITKHNVDELEQIVKLAEDVGAMTFNPFLLVPTGRGKELAEQEISPEQYEETLHWLSRLRSKITMQLRVTCAPHFQRIIRQDKSAEAGEAKKGHGPVGHGAMTAGGCGHGHGYGGKKGFQPAGCMGGKSFAFISHVGRVQICGFLETVAGDLKANGLDFESIWKDSEFFRQIRDVDNYGGKCGYCEYRRLCGGCRARAFAMTGDYLETEPFCVYEPEKR
ncbi:MAG: radical SAM protein [Planctomycetes bacterium]|nr:radical SAM protein [Planctomycetota bacterium]